jgi:hypothetical protein
MLSGASTAQVPVSAALLLSIVKKLELTMFVVTISGIISIPDLVSIG